MIIFVVIIVLGDDESNICIVLWGFQQYSSHIETMKG